MISIKDLTISYDKQSTVIDSLDLSMEENSIHGIVGLNGAGKTTLLNAIYGLIKTDSGEIHRADQKITKRDISYLTTENYFYSNITGREYIGLFRNVRFDLDKWNELFSLPLDELIDHYSTGMKKKLVLLSILKQDKPVLILDEPFNGLDMETCRIIRSILLRLKEREKTIIITSHIMETLTNLCDYIHYLEYGKIVLTTDKTHFQEFEDTLFKSIENKNIGLITELID
ncbi:ATP-binding cassette domain-containing protein [Proteiniphilum acetatigenes]|uniref:ABC transporter ATP-binding protein n=1 Tax=Proteiniphilum acetatigenes TaxID=294710 RepID=UPI0003802BD6|nr:ATP-binding cassette domain-containing protein [Proteiniphilum acetatigenes]SFK45317.1 ABC-2 type transport system ATP-binding protein [Porphyromonadaceae bacterium KH3CP3RA]